jgi:MauM/NapG family ferredoxin protein
MTTQLSRRQLFGFGWMDALRGVLPEAHSAAPRAPVFLRPPGALPEPEFLAACTRCDACLIACPKESIRRAGHELSAANEGTPVILPLDQPCWMCKGMPCIPVCEPGALRSLSSPGAARMGRIHVREEACYAAQGNLCDVCAERCPVRPKAIRVSMGAAPELAPELCTGCAVCAWLCPAKAIEVERLES